jgi:hypothetical protein
MDEGLAVDYKSADQIERSKVKLIRSGNVIEAYEYQKAVILGKKGGGRMIGDEVSKREIENRNLSLRRARNNIRRIVNANFGKGSKFVTLTYRDQEWYPDTSQEIVSPKGMVSIDTLGQSEGRTQEGASASLQSVRDSDVLTDEMKLFRELTGNTHDATLTGGTTRLFPGDSENTLIVVGSDGELQYMAGVLRENKTSEEPWQNEYIASESSLGKKRGRSRDRTAIDIRDVDQTNKDFKKFIQRLRDYVESIGYDRNFKYLAVIEFQDKNRDGVVHYHMIADIPYIANEKLREVWGQGWVRINKIDHCDNVGAYVVKYMVEDMNDPRLRRRKAYLVGKGMQKSEVIQGEVAHVELLRMEKENKKNRVYENSYPSEYCGTITFTEYNLDRDGSKDRPGRYRKKVVDTK